MTPGPGSGIDPAPGASLAQAAKRAAGQFRAHQMTDAAASLTYYAMLALFPLLIAVTSLFSLVGDPQTVANFVDYLARQGADAETRRAVDNVMTRIVESSGSTAGVALVVSLGIALNGASGAFGAAGRALNRVHGTQEDRSFVRRKLTDLAMTLICVLLVGVLLLALFLGGGIAQDLFGEIGLGSTAASIWSIARWPLALLAAMVAYGLVYAYAPDVEPHRLRWLSPGAVAGVVIWLVASVLFALYIQNLSTYGAAYGTFGAALVLLLWLWISSCAFLLGAELNAEIERAETAGRGGPPPVTPPPSALPPGSEPAREGTAPADRDR